MPRYRCGDAPPPGCCFSFVCNGSSDPIQTPGFSSSPLPVSIRAQQRFSCAAVAAATLRRVAVSCFYLLFPLRSRVRGTVPSPTRSFLLIGMNWWIFGFFCEPKLTDIDIYSVAQTVPDSVIGRTIEMATVVVCVCMCARTCVCEHVCMSVCAHLCVRVSVRMSVCAFVSVCVRVFDKPHPF